MQPPLRSSAVLTHDLLELAFEASGDCIKVISLDGTILVMNAGGATAVGLEDPHCLVGHNWADSWQGEDREAAQKGIETARAGTRVDGLRGYLPAGRETARWWESSVIPVPGADGTPAHLLIISKNVTAHREEMRALQTLARRHQALIEAVSEIVWHFDVEGQVAHRRGWAAFTGQQSEPTLPDAWLDVVHPDDQAGARASTKRAAARPEPFTAEYRLWHKSGTWRWVEDRAVPVFDDAGKLTEWVGIVTDIHDRVSAETGLRASEERLRLAIQATGLGTWDVDIRTGTRQWSSELKSMLGLAPDVPATEQVLLDHIHPDDRAAVAKHNVTTFLQTSVSASATFRIVRADTEETRWITSQGRVVLAEDGQSVRRIGTFQDVTEHYETKQALHLAVRRYEALIAATSEIVWHASASQDSGDGTGWREFTGQSAEEANGEGWLDVVHPDDREQAKLTCERAVAAGSPYTNEYRLFHVSGEWRWVIDRVVPMVGDDGKVAEWVGIISDIHDRKLADHAIWIAAHTDPLTGVANRTAFQQSLDDALANAAHAEKCVGLIVIDLDRFKEVNDSLGHDAGDLVLRTVAKRLQDGVLPAATIARLGGDEFGLILPNADGLKQIEAMAAAILTSLKRPLQHGNRELDCSASIGCSIHPFKGEEASALLKNADIAMYAAKKAGGGQAVAFAPSMRAEVERRLNVLRRTKDALARDAVVPFYQPKISLEDGNILGFEALLRWTDETGLRSPDDIREAFDDAELAIKLGSRMLERIVADMRTWISAGIPFGHVALNIAAHEFHDPDFARRIVRTLEAARLQPSHLEIEVTESVLLGDGTEAIGTILEALDAAGIAIALDDFGTGYASLTHLKKYPVSWLKIDRSFVSNIETDNDSAAIVRAVLGLAQSIGIKVVAEGVETERQMRFLQQNRCEVAQGFLMAKPMAGSRVPHYVASWDSTQVRFICPPLTLGVA